MGTSGGSYEIFRNTIVSPRSFGIRFTYRTGSGHVIRDNEIFSPGNQSEAAFIYVGQNAASVEVLRNRTERERPIERTGLR
jgi:capsular polysaccharide biosynthesis protein